MPIRIASFHPLHLAVAGYGVASAEVLAAITPAGFTTWVQALNVALMVTGSTLIILWQRAQNAARQERIASEAERHQSYQLKIGQLAGQLDEVCHDREVLWQQLGEIAQRIAKLACPFAVDDVAHCRVSGATEPPPDLSGDLPCPLRG